VSKRGCETQSRFVEVLAGEDRSEFFRLACGESRVVDDGAGGNQNAAAAAVLRRARTAFTRGDYRQALADCKEALALQPGNEEALNLKERVEQTLVVLGVSGSTDAGHHLQRAERLFEAGRYEEARQACDQALRIDPSNRRARDLRQKIESTIRILRGG
jgi:tetratricopeptide (TPR) repeat protein